MFRGTGGGLYDIDEFTLLGEGGPGPSPESIGNLALNRPATASSQEGADVPASAAVDGDPATRWSSEFSDPQWIQVDLGTARPIGRGKLLWEAAYGSAYQIQTSADGTTWTTERSVTGGGTDEQTGLGANGRYLRINGTAPGYRLRLLALGTGGVTELTSRDAQPTHSGRAADSGVQGRPGSPRRARRRSRWRPVHPARQGCRR